VETEQMSRLRYSKNLRREDRLKLEQLRIPQGQTRRELRMSAGQTKRAQTASCCSNPDRADFAMNRALNRNISSLVQASLPRRSQTNMLRERRQTLGQKSASSSARDYLRCRRSWSQGHAVVNDRRQDQITPRFPVPHEERNRAHEPNNRKDLASPYPRWTQLILSRDTRVNDNKQRRFRFPFRIKYFTTHRRMLLHLTLAEVLRVLQGIEYKKRAIRHLLERSTATRKWLGGTEILEKHRALRRPNQRRPITSLPGLVVDLELSKRSGLTGTHENALRRGFPRLALSSCPKEDPTTPKYSSNGSTNLRGSRYDVRNGTADVRLAGRSQWVTQHEAEIHLQGLNS
jgi:hypothetical protein